ncbi:recombinase family protein [Mycolicibacterium mageritense]|uniref:Recombinase family protein n=1 Tax=Mycolicibacterium mageritense TaxID=53462 RepID=A0AAI8U2I4_MYCME|nr:recombinase family protein [Mycolicibacterium mageritense]BDY33002.1 hypothetical protein hbim_06974 [Mycolicibacterium mageritense]
MEEASRRVGIYLRISSDIEGKGYGVERQEALCRELCERKGWQVAEVFSDNDISAYNQKKQRPRYLALLEAIRSREIDAVVAWHPDRLHRQMRELVPFMDLVDKYNVRIETVQAGEYDLSTAEGRMRAEITGSVAAYESRHKSNRIKAKLEQNAARGKHHGGSRPYGWKSDRVTLDPVEAEGVREAAQLLLAGESVKAIARHMNDRGYTTSTGRPWRDVTVRDMLKRPRNAGIRVHHDEELGPGQWEPILSVSDFRQVSAILSAPGRNVNPGKNGRVHLLSTIARCGVCDGTVVVAKGKVYDGVGGRRSGGKSVYRCRNGHVIRDQQRVDDFVTKAILARLRRKDAARVLAQPGKADAAHAAAVKAQQLQDRLHDAAKGYAAGVIDFAMLTTIKADLQPQIDKAKSEAASPDRDKALGDLVRDPDEVWKSLTPERKRTVVTLLVDVTINPTHRGKVFDPDAIKVVFKG